MLERICFDQGRVIVYTSVRVRAAETPSGDRYRDTDMRVPGLRD